MNCVSDFVKRKTLIYRSKVPGCDHAVNHVQGCSHGCRYPCYAFLMSVKFGKAKDYQDWIKPKLVLNAVEIIANEISKKRQRVHKVNLCLMTDPFMYGYEDIQSTSLEIIRILNEADISCSVLTKGLLPIELSDMSKNNTYGISLVSVSDEFRKKYEPGASNYNERIDCLRKLKDRGCRTYVHMEPYPPPNIFKQDIDRILKNISFADEIDVGRLNYNNEAAKYEGLRDFYSSLQKRVNDHVNKRF